MSVDGVCSRLLFNNVGVGYRIRVYDRIYYDVPIELWLKYLPARNSHDTFMLTCLYVSLGEPVQLKDYNGTLMSEDEYSGKIKVVGMNENDVIKLSSLLYQIESDTGVVLYNTHTLKSSWFSKLKWRYSLDCIHNGLANYSRDRAMSFLLNNDFALSYFSRKGETLKTFKKYFMLSVGSGLSLVGAFVLMYDSKVEESLSLKTFVFEPGTPNNVTWGIDISFFTDFFSSSASLSDSKTDIVNSLLSSFPINLNSEETVLIEPRRFITEHALLFAIEDLVNNNFSNYKEEEFIFCSNTFN